MLKHKNNIIIICLLLVILILPRMAVYPNLGVGLVGTDGQVRYFVQAEQLSESFANFFTQTGPLYSAFLMLFGEITNDMVKPPLKWKKPLNGIQWRL